MAWLFGTRFVIESDLFGRLSSAELVRPRSEELGDDEGVEAVVLAGTDLSLVFNASYTDFPNLDCAGVHIQAIMRRSPA